MIYGDTIIFKYDDILPKVNEKGETIIENGEIVVENIEKTIKLRMTPMTFIHYKNNTGKELIYEYAKMGIKGERTNSKLSNAEKLAKQLGEKKVEDISDKELDELIKLSQENLESGNEFIQFFQDVVIAMIMTYNNDRNKTVEEIAEQNLVSDTLIQNGKFIEEVTALLNFAIKKKYGQP